MTEFAIQLHKPLLSIGTLTHLLKRYKVLIDRGCRIFNDTVSTIIQWTLSFQTENSKN